MRGNVNVKKIIILFFIFISYFNLLQPGSTNVSPRGIPLTPPSAAELAARRGQLISSLYAPNPSAAAASLVSARRALCMTTPAACLPPVIRMPSPAPTPRAPAPLLLTTPSPAPLLLTTPPPSPLLLPPSALPSSATTPVRRSLQAAIQTPQGLVALPLPPGPILTPVLVPRRLGHAPTLASAATVAAAARPMVNGTPNLLTPHRMHFVPTPPSMVPQSVDFQIQPCRVTHPTSIMRVTDCDISLDFVAGDAATGEGDTVLFVTNVHLNLAGVGNMTIQASTRVPAPPSSAPSSPRSSDV